MLVAIALSALILQALSMFKNNEDNSPAGWEVDVEEFVIPIELFKIISRLSEEDMMDWANPADVIEIIELSDFVSELDHENFMAQLDEMIDGCDAIIGRIQANDIVCQMLAA